MLDMLISKTLQRRAEASRFFWAVTVLVGKTQPMQIGIQSSRRVLVVGMEPK